MISLGEQLFDSMERYSSMCALKIGSRQISYEELNSKALSVAGFLSSHGMVNQNVGIVTQRSLSAYAGILGTIYAGCAYVPINPKYPKERIADIVEQAEIEVLVGDESDWREVGQKIQNLEGVEYVLFPESTDVCLEKPLNGVAENQLASIEKLSRPLKTEADENVYIMFTSGSTGRPKGVQVTRKNLHSFLDNMLKFIDLGPGYISAQVHDLSFDFSVFQVFFPMLTGGTNCIVPEEEKYCPSDFINREEVNLWSSVPTIAEMMNKLSALEVACFPSVKYSIFCGEPLTQQTADAWMIAAPNSTVENFYGPTETTVFVSRYVYIEEDVSRMFHNDIVPIGKPLADHQMVLLDEENNVAGEREVGEIAIRGAQVSKGYLNDSKKTKSVFVSMPWDPSGSIWYKTGDLAMINEEGNLEYVSRKDNQIKIAGRRIEIGEVESALRGKVKGEDAVVVPIRGESGIVQSLVAFVTTELTDDDIKVVRDSCAVSIENLFFPKEFLYVEKIPTTISGKVDRKLLEQKAWETKKIIKG